MTTTHPDLSDGDMPGDTLRWEPGSLSSTTLDRILIDALADAFRDCWRRDQSPGQQDRMFADRVNRAVTCATGDMRGLRVTEISDEQLRLLIQQAKRGWQIRSHHHDEDGQLIVEGVDQAGCPFRGWVSELGTLYGAPTDAGRSIERFAVTLAPVEAAAVRSSPIGDAARRAS